jgi:hypothetical protein
MHHHAPLIHPLLSLQALHRFNAQATLHAQNLFGPLRLNRTQGMKRTLSTDRVLRVVIL